MKLKKIGAVAFALGVTAIPFQQAQADATASAVIEFSNFQVWGQISGGALRQLDTSDFTSLRFRSTADADTTLQGSTESISNAIDSNSDGIDFPFTYPAGTVVSPAGNDLCIGDCGGALVGTGQNNNFDHIVQADITGDGTGNYAWADQLESGSPITGLTNSDGDPVDPSADVANASYGHVANAGSGGANSDNGLNSEFTFVSGFDLDFIEFRFDVDAFAYAFMSPGAEGLAAADALFNLDIDNGTSWCLRLGPTDTCTLGAPASSNISGSVGATRLSDGTSMETQSGSFSYFSSAGLDAGTEYTLSARLETSVEVLQVPEPGVLALMGLGLGALGMASRRRRRV